MTDSEIKKALECCSEANNCGQCEYEPTEHQIGTVGCCNELMKDALDLINRLQEEIEKLTSGKCVYLSDDETTEYCVEGPCPNYKTVAQIKAEAYKECIEKVKDMVDNWDYNLSLFPDINKAMNNLDNLLKELVGEADDKY